MCNHIIRKDIFKLSSFPFAAEHLLVCEYNQFSCKIVNSKQISSGREDDPDIDVITIEDYINETSQEIVSTEINDDAALQERSTPSKVLYNYKRHKCSKYFTILKKQIEEEQQRKAIQEVNEHHNYNKPSCLSLQTNSKEVYVWEPRFTVGIPTVVNESLTNLQNSQVIENLALQSVGQCSGSRENWTNSKRSQQRKDLKELILQRQNLEKLIQQKMKKTLEPTETNKKPSKNNVHDDLERRRKPKPTETNKKPSRSKDHNDLERGRRREMSDLFTGLMRSLPGYSVGKESIPKIKILKNAEKYPDIDARTIDKTTTETSSLEKKSIEIADGVTLHERLKGMLCGSIPSKPLKTIRRHKCSSCFAVLKRRMDEQRRLQKAVLEVNEHHNYSKPACSSPRTNANGVGVLDNAPSTSDAQQVCDVSHDLQVEDDQAPHYPRLSSFKSFSQDWASNKLFKQMKLKDTKLKEQNKNKEREKKCAPKRKRGKGKAKKGEPKRTYNNGKWERKPIQMTLHNIKTREDRQVLAKHFYELICCVNGNSPVDNQNKKIAQIHILKMSTEYIKFLKTESWKLDLERKQLEKQNLFLVENLQTLQKKK
ncbi:unnamed protein product [Mytilus coruscus]|uniref:BHLH domain-containing protein n=1 Tax=Mytilus coruscus TaxID=42192 RepID=A0A6J8DFG3_MYTCO|nr:unnamed protein product [Mytilus coruscus]